jgi:hypothetical protein
MRPLDARGSPLVTPVVLAALTLLYMAPVVLAPPAQLVLDGHDLLNQQYPLYSFIFDSVREGRGLPLWNPYQFAGQSTVTNPQSTLFYPLAWLMALVDVGHAVGWLAALHLWLGGGGMAVFVRRLGASRGGALAGGIVYEFSALLGAHLDAGHINYVLCQAWLPWTAAAYLQSVSRQSWLRPALWGAMALGLCVLSGYPPLWYFAGLWLLALWLFIVITASDHSLRAAVRALLPLLVIASGGAILGAVLLLPVEQFSLLSTRAQSPSLAFSGSYPLTGSQVLTLLVPNLFGQPRLPGDGYWGVPFYEELTAYVGVLPLLALFLARRRPAAILMLIFAALGLIVSLGIDGGLFTLLYRLLPGYSLFRAPSRALYFVVIGAAGSIALLITDLQAASVDERASMLRTAVYRVLPLLALLALLASLALGVYFTRYSTDPAPPWKIYYDASMLGNSAVMLGAAWLALRAWLARAAAPHTGWLVALTIGVLLIDLWRLSSQHVNVSAFDVPELWQAMERAAPASPDFRVMTVPGDRVVWQAGAAYTRHLNAGGYDPLISDAYQRLLEASRYNPTSPVARLLGVRYAIGDAPFEQSHLPGADRLTLLKQDRPWYIYTVSDALPRAFVVPVVVTEPDDAAVRRQIAAGEVVPGRTVFVPQPVACTAPSTDTAPTGSAHITRYEPNAVEVAVDSSQGGVLVLSDAYDPNWDVRVDGAPSNLLRVDTALRGVCVSPGAHRITFDYAPRLFIAGLIISVAGWLAIGGLLLWRR